MKDVVELFGANFSLTLEDYFTQLEFLINTAEGMTDSGSTKWDALGQAQFQKQVAIVLDGIVQSAPTIQPNNSSAKIRLDRHFYHGLNGANNSAMQYVWLRSRPKAGVNGAGHRFCFETYQVIEERTYARACTSIAD